MDHIISFFTLENLVHEAIWLLLAATIRLWLRWGGMSWQLRREVTYWGLVVLTIVVVFGLIASVPGLRPTAVTVEQPKPQYDPELSCNLSYVLAMTQTQLIFVVASVSNAGSPSAVSNMDLIIQVPGAEPRESTQKVLTDPILIPSANGMRRFFAADALYAKTMNDPIETGGVKWGLALFKSEISGDNLARPGTTYTLKVRDVSGIWTECAGKMSDTRTPLSNYPGIRSETVSTEGDANQ